MRKTIVAVMIIVLVPLIIFKLGPVPDFEEVTSDMPTIDVSLEQLDTWISAKESFVEDIKPNNKARVVWADSIRKTDWSIVYLHGFSASHREGFPVNTSIAKKYGMNLFLSRIAGHGIDDEDSFEDLTPADMVNSAKEALVIGRLIGDKVILMSCSTGGTYSIYLAAQQKELVDALVMYSPNIELYDSNAKLLSGPWGLELARTLIGEYSRYEDNIGTPKEQYTTSIYRVEGLVALQAMLDQTMRQEYFEQVSQPAFVGYYYKDEQAQDKVVSVQAMKDFVKNIATDKDQIREVAFPESGNHVICSDLHSSDYQGVISETELFLQEVLGLYPVDASITFEPSE